LNAYYLLPFTRFSMKLKQILGIIITVIGILCAGFGAYVLMQGETNLFGSPINRWEALVPLILGLIFFSAGVSLVRSIRG
jgi:uncharacterized membrane protein